MKPINRVERIAYNYESKEFRIKMTDWQAERYGFYKVAIEVLR